jgi:hypothetical protein
MCNTSEIDVPVRLGCVDHELWITPGDIVIGDADGVVLLPRALAARVAEMVPQSVSGAYLPLSISLVADEKVLEEVLNGVSVEEAFRKHRGKL